MLRIFVEESTGKRSIGLGSGHLFVDQTDKPFPTVLAARPVRIQVREVEGPDPMPDTTKPPYRVSSMTEIETVCGTNGYDVVSTFSGGGGSCLGFKMEGFRVLWASEFVEEARATYALNHPGVLLDGRDIREVTAAEILKTIGKAEGELDVFEGSPPCASFSMSGSREKTWGKEKAYSDTKQRADDLFFEYARLVEGLRPRVFVAENVKGLVIGKAVGYFKEIHRRLSRAGYVVEARLLDAQWLGVPQRRARVIFVGVREDLGQAPVFPVPLPYRYTVRDALPHVTRVIHDTSGLRGMGEVTDQPCPCVTVGVNSINSLHFKVEDAGVKMLPPSSRAEWEKLGPVRTERALFQPGPGGHGRSVNDRRLERREHGPTEPRKFTIPELRRICGFPDDFKLTGSFAQQWERLGRAVPPLMMARIAAEVRGILDRCPKA